MREPELPGCVCAWGVDSARAGMTHPSRKPNSAQPRTAPHPGTGHHQPEEIAQQATSEIAARYGGLDNFGKALEDREDMAASLGEVIWLITLLAHQSVQIHNLTHPSDQCPGLTTKAVELLTVPADLADYRGAISVALSHGTRRAIHVESDPKEPTPTRSRSSP